MFYVYIFLVIVGVLIVVSIPLGIIGDKIRSKNLEKVFGGRQELTNGIFTKGILNRRAFFFRHQKIREILEDVLDADLSRLLAEDDFQKLEFLLAGRFIG
jgi:hypothetical protein